MKRPLSVTVIAWLFIAAGAVGFAYHLSEFNADHPFQFDHIWVSLIRLLAILGGISLLRGRNWARWLLLLWMTFHVILSAFHSVSELIIHAVFLVVLAFFLLGPGASAFFRRDCANSPRTPGSDDLA